MLDPRIVLQSVLVMALLCLPIFVVRKKKLLGPELGSLFSFVILYIAQPCMIADAFLRPFSWDIAKGMGIQLALGLFLYLAAFALVKLFFRKTEKSKQAVLRFMMIFSNCGFMGFPVLRAVLPGETGNIAVIYAIGIVVWFNIFTWTLGIRMFNGQRMSWRHALLNPGILGAGIGMLLFATSAVTLLPAPVLQANRILGEMVTPLSMFIIGGRLAEVTFRELFMDWRIWAATFVRLVVAPVLVLLLCRLITLLGIYPFTGLMLAVPFLLMSMPAAANTVILAERFGGNPHYGSAGVALSTLLSVATVPLLSILLTL